MLIEAADEVMVGQQVKHCQDYMMLMSSIDSRLTFGFHYESGWLLLDGK